MRDVGNEEPHISNLELSTTVLLLIDPQNDFLSEGGVMWDVVGDGVKKTKVVEHLVELRHAATVTGVPVFYSPHHFSDYEFATWKRMNVIDERMFDQRMARGPGWGADVHPDLAPDESTFILSPHIARSGFWGVDISIQFRQRDIETIVIAGASASLCMTSNLRHAEARGYRVLIVKDATTGPANEEIQAAVAHHGLIAKVVTTDEITDGWRNAAAAPTTWNCDRMKRTPEVRRGASAITSQHFGVRPE